MSSSESVWHVGRLVALPDAPASYTYVEDHPLSDKEAEDLTSAVLAIHAFSGQSVTGRAIDSANELLTALSAKGADQRLGSDVAFRSEVGRLVESWVSQHVALRRRIEHEAEVHFGVDAKKAVAAVFENAFDKDGYFRTVWELRNASEHGHTILNLISVRVKHGEHSSETTLMLQLNELQQARGPKIGEVLATFWGEAVETDVIIFIRMAAEGLKTLIARAYLALEPQLTSALELFSREAQNVVHDPGLPCLFRMEREGTGATFQNTLLELSAYRAVTAALDASRERLAPPRVGPDGVIY